MFMLGIFNPQLGANYIKKARSCIDCPTMHKYLKPKTINSNRTGKTIAYRIKLKNPNYFAFSHPLTRFKKGEEYHVGTADINICTKLGMVPAYMVNLDKFTLLKLWGSLAQELFSPQSKPFEENEYTFWRLQPNKGRFPELSSMNFILRNDTEWKKENDEETVNLIIKYFKFFYWK